MPLGLLAAVDVVDRVAHNYKMCTVHHDAPNAFLRHRREFLAPMIKLTKFIE